MTEAAKLAGVALSTVEGHVREAAIDDRFKVKRDGGRVYIDKASFLADRESRGRKQPTTVPA